MKDWMIDAMLITDEQAERQDKRKANRKKKLAIDEIKGWLVCGNIKKVIDIAEKHGIDAKEFGKIARGIA